MAYLDELQFQIAPGSYLGFRFEDAAVAMPVLAATSGTTKKEVVARTAIGARVATLDAVVTDVEIAEAIEGLLFAVTTFDAGDEVTHPVVVLQATRSFPIFTGGAPEAHVVHLELREAGEPFDSDSDSGSS
jgi:hypothetical protein